MLFRVTYVLPTNVDVHFEAGKRVSERVKASTLVSDSGSRINLYKIFLKIEEFCKIYQKQSNLE